MKHNVIYQQVPDNTVQKWDLQVICMRVILKFIQFHVSDEWLLWSVESRHGWNQFLPLSAAACQKYNQKECRTRCGPTSEQKSLLIHLLDRARSIVSAKQTIRYKLLLALPWNRVLTDGQSKTLPDINLLSWIRVTYFLIYNSNETVVKKCFLRSKNPTLLILYMIQYIFELL